MKGESLEIVKNAKLLGVILTSDLKWNRNTAKIVRGPVKTRFVAKSTIMADSRGRSGTSLMSAFYIRGPTISPLYVEG